MITLTSDFGTPYPAAMKGVILSRCDARLVDISHEFPRQDVRTTAFWLSEILPEFPPAVHLVVVDPGVGTDRSALVVRAGDHVLVGPDNGTLFPPARALADGDQKCHADMDAYEIDIKEPRSATFHGRDVFAPAAAEIHAIGTDRLAALDMLSPAEDIVEIEFPTPEIEHDSVRGEVLVTDGFGNVITNIPGEILDGYDEITVNGRPKPVEDSYAAVEPGMAIVTVGSHGNVELAVNQGRGDDAFGLDIGDPVRIEL